MERQADAAMCLALWKGGTKDHWQPRITSGKKGVTLMMP